MQVHGNIQQLVRVDFDIEFQPTTPKSPTGGRGGPAGASADRKASVTALLSMSGRGDLEAKEKDRERDPAEGFFASLLSQLGQLVKARMEMIRV